ncbi:MAG: hypothetical protein ABW168_17105 [Sedimenticola sp.]
MGLLESQLHRVAPQSSIGLIAGRKWHIDRLGDFELTHHLMATLIDKSAADNYSSSVLETHLLTSGEEDDFLPTQIVGGRLAQYLSGQVIFPVRVAESCKYPHVSYFFKR